MAATSIVSAILTVSEGILGNEKISGKILGKYSDGSVRSIPDAVNGEIISPKDRDKAKKKKKKHKKKNKLRLY